MEPVSNGYKLACPECGCGPSRLTVGHHGPTMYACGSGWDRMFDPHVFVQSEPCRRIGELTAALDEIARLRSENDTMRRLLATRVETDRLSEANTEIARLNGIIAEMRPLLTEMRDCLECHDEVAKVREKRLEAEIARLREAVRVRDAVKCPCGCGMCPHCCAVPDEPHRPDCPILTHPAIRENSQTEVPHG